MFNITKLCICFVLIQKMSYFYNLCIESKYLKVNNICLEYDVVSNKLNNKCYTKSNFH